MGLIAGLGSGLGFGGRRRPTVLLSLDFSVLTPGVMTSLATLSGGALAFTRSGAGAGQTSASTYLVTGLNTDVALVRQRGAAGTGGMAHRPARTNSVGASRDFTATSWTVGSLSTIAAAYATSADGTSNGTRIQVQSGGYSKYALLSIPSPTKPAIMTIWQKIGLGSAINQIGIDDLLSGELKGVTLTSSWATYSVANATTPYSGQRGSVPADGRDFSSVGGVVAGARDVVADLVQWEIGQYSTDTIITTSGAAARSYERVYAPTASAIVSGGRIEMYAKIVSYGSSTNFLADDATTYFFKTNDGLSYASFNSTSGVVSVVTAGGSAWSSAVIPAWSAGDTIEFKIKAGGGAVVSSGSYAVNGGAYTSLGSSGSPQAAIGTSSPVNLLGDQAAGSFAGDVQKLTFYTPGGMP